MDPVKGQGFFFFFFHRFVNAQIFGWFFFSDFFLSIRFVVFSMAIDTLLRLEFLRSVMRFFLFGFYGFILLFMF